MVVTSIFNDFHRGLGHPAPGAAVPRYQRLEACGKRWNEAVMSSQQSGFPVNKVNNWLVVGPPLRKISINWDNYPQYMGK